MITKNLKKNYRIRHLTGYTYIYNRRRFQLIGCIDNADNYGFNSGFPL